MPQPDDTRDGSTPDAEPAESAEPRNRAERRAQRRGKKQPPPPAGGKAGPDGRQAPVVMPRRAGRRGNR